VGVLLGPDHLLATQAKDYCNLGICGALVVGTKCQPDIEELLANGFVRKVGTVYCKNVKAASGMDCQQRCEAVLQTMQKAIDK
jgi:hypothetical protein